MKRIVRLIQVVAAVSVIFLTGSCRSVIFEDRFVCPKFLYFDVTNAESFNHFETVYATAFTHPDWRLYDKDTTHLALMTPDPEAFHFSIRSSNAVRGYGVLGLSNCVIEGDSNLVIPIGMESDPLFHFVYESPVEEESFVVPVEFVKDYSRVTIQFEGMETFVSADGQFPFNVLLTSNTRGIDAMTGLPLEGRFETYPKEQTIGRFVFNLPRQFDHSLRMELYGKPGVYDRYGLVDTFDLWRKLRDEGGITWQEKNLPDVELTINYQEMSVSVSVSPWQEEYVQYEY